MTEMVVKAVCIKGGQTCGLQVRETEARKLVMGSVTKQNFIN